jgi:hypothetical protein
MSVPMLRVLDINLPVCGLALAALMFTLKLNPSRGNVAELKRTFDYVGL